MIMYAYADQLRRFSKLSDTMFKHRAEQFKGRLDWNVHVDARGWEVDEYDSLNPLYVIWQNPDGTHGGSVRIMPTMGRIMTNEQFLDLTGGVKIQSPLIWECTRFCLAPNATSGVAAALLAAGVELGLRCGIEQALGVIYKKTTVIYRRIGSEPEIIGSRGIGPEEISVGLWPVSIAARNQIAQKSGIPLAAIAHWFDTSFSGVDSHAPGDLVAA